jgi:hypothetical protein
MHVVRHAFHPMGRARGPTADTDGGRSPCGFAGDLCSRLRACRGLPRAGERWRAVSHVPFGVDDAFRFRRERPVASGIRTKPHPSAPGSRSSDGLGRTSRRRLIAGAAARRATVPALLLPSVSRGFRPSRPPRQSTPEHHFGTPRFERPARHAGAAWATRRSQVRARECRWIRIGSHPGPGLPRSERPKAYGPCRSPRRCGALSRVSPTTKKATASNDEAAPAASHGLSLPRVRAPGDPPPLAVAVAIAAVPSSPAHPLYTGSV